VVVCSYQRTSVVLGDGVHEMLVCADIAAGAALTSGVIDIESVSVCEVLACGGVDVRLW
jgi:hypothetical protein